LKDRWQAAEMRLPGFVWIVLRAVDVEKGLIIKLLLVGSEYGSKEEFRASVKLNDCGYLRLQPSGRTEKVASDVDSKGGSGPGSRVGWFESLDGDTGDPGKDSCQIVAHGDFQLSAASHGC
jgi:hypothetical protein